MLRTKSQWSFSSNGPWAPHRGACVCAAILLLCAIAEAQDYYDYDLLEEADRIVKPAGSTRYEDYQIYYNLRPLPDKPAGVWTLKKDYNPEALALTAAQQKAVAAKMETLASILHVTPVFNPPIGFWLKVRASYSDEGRKEGQDLTKIPAMAELDITLTGIMGGWHHEWVANPGQVSDAHVGINNLVRVLWWDVFDSGGHTRLLPDGRMLSFTPRETGRVAGFPIYNYKILVLSKPRPRPLGARDR